jgi:hypothetical protein
MIEQIFFAVIGVALLTLTFKLVHKDKFTFAFLFLLLLWCRFFLLQRGFKA